MRLRVEKNIRDVHLRFIESNGSGRIRTDTYDAYASCPENVIIVCYLQWGAIRALSASILEGKECTKSITITQKGWRKQGLGSLVLQYRLSLLPGYSIATLVAEDNHASNRLVNRVGMIKTGEIESVRKAGPYKALIYEKEV